MTNIKTRTPESKTIKTLNKSAVSAEKFKETILDAKSKVYKTTNEDTVYEYESGKITDYSKSASSKFIHYGNKYGRKSAVKTKQNYRKLKHQISRFKKKRNAVKSIKKAKANIKKGKVAIQKTAKHTKTMAKTTKQTAKVSAQAIKGAVKATVSAVKAIIAGTKALISAIVAGGWIAVVIIVVVSLLAFLLSSAYGIFFSNEVNTGDITMSSIISEINEEVNNKIVEIENTNEHDDYELVSNMSKWEELLALYSAKISNGDMKSDVITLDESKKKILKDLFWQMNTITSSVSDKKMLTITISSKSLNEMMDLNNFSNEQRIQVRELLDSKYSAIWTDVIYGKSVGNKDVVKIAEKQIGNAGGQKFWSWYGFNSRVEWCAIFVSWVANEAGYLNKTIPKFAQCHNQGIVWFKSMSLWHDRAFVPKSGDIIFFDWQGDGHSDHVGIVEKVSNGKVYTIEGNSGDRVQRQNYTLNSKVIYGYGTPQY